MPFVLLIAIPVALYPPEVSVPLSPMLRPVIAPDCDAVVVVIKFSRVPPVMDVEAMYAAVPLVREFALRTNPDEVVVNDVTPLFIVTVP